MQRGWFIHRGRVQTGDHLYAMVMLMHRGLIHGEVYTGLCASMNKRCCCCCYTEGGLQTEDHLYTGVIYAYAQGAYTQGEVYTQGRLVHRGVYTQRAYIQGAHLCTGGLQTGGRFIHREGVAYTWAGTISLPKNLSD